MSAALGKKNYPGVEWGEWDSPSVRVAIFFMKFLDEEGTMKSDVRARVLLRLYSMVAGAS